MPVNRRIVLASRPRGAATVENFRLEEVPVPALQEGEVLVRNHWLSLDPYMRGRMDEAKSYADPQPLDEVMIGGTAGVVEASRHPDFAAGDAVVGAGGWQEYFVVRAGQRGALRHVDTSRVRLSAYLGAAGMPGITAWYGLTEVIEASEGQTIVVSSAAGAVGSVVGQLAKARGLRAVGIAGGPQKCAWVVDELGLDACIDHRAHADAASLRQALAAACPQGIDGDFENVGGMVLDAVLPLMNAHGRIALCGMIAGYDGRPIPLARPQLILQRRLRVEGFIIGEHTDCWSTARKELVDLLVAGRLKYRESVSRGLESAPEAFLGMLHGRNFGKQLVDLA